MKVRERMVMDSVDVMLRVYVCMMCECVRGIWISEMEMVGGFGREWGCEWLRFGGSPYLKVLRCVAVVFGPCYRCVVAWSMGTTALAIGGCWSLLSCISGDEANCW